MKGIFRLRSGNGTFWPRDQFGVESPDPIHAGETIECEEWQLGGHLHRFELVESIPTPPLPPANVGLRAVHRGGGRYDVVNETTGKPINSATLSKAEAFEMVQDAPRPEMDQDDGEVEPNPAVS